MSGLVSNLLISALSRLTTCSGVPAGANKPYQVLTSKFLIPDSAKPRGAIFRVVAVGPRVAEVAVGDSVILQEGALQRVAFGESSADALGVPGARLGLVHERHIYAVVEL